MTGYALLALLIGGIAASGEAILLVRWSPERFTHLNHAGRWVPAVLGWALSFGILTGVFVAGLIVQASEPALGVGITAWAVTCILLVAGLVDDAFGDGATRGIGGHLRSLARGRPTTGILKLVVGVAAAVLVAPHLADDPVRLVGIAVLVALSTNLWNALDVMPGRALKWGAVALVLVVAAAWSRPSVPLLAAALGAVLALLPFDLRERGMLGDAGSNPLGFLVGLGLALVLPTPALLAAAAVALLLQVAAETVTISRLIEAVPPLRWFDRLGRRPEPVS